jgi:hypothetical protein
VSRDIESIHRSAYISEKQRRWDMEDQCSNTILTTFSTYILQKLPFLTQENVKFQRFDEMWFNAYSPLENEWVKGCPDFIGSLTNKETRFLFIELKIKDDGIFRKTYTGGVTKNGSIIPSYGCHSFYLDIVPVYRNMKDFCAKTLLLTRSFLVLFAKKNSSPKDIFLITLAEIDILLKEVWKGIKIAEFGEEYGQKTYLIPQDATQLLTNITKEYIYSLLQKLKFTPN